MDLNAVIESQGETITRLRTALSVAREALEKIARLRTDLSGDYSMGSHQSDIARTALNEMETM